MRKIKMKTLNSIISFCFGVFFLLAFIYTSFEYIKEFEMFQWKSIDVYLIFLFGILFVLYSIQNIIMAFKKKKTTKRVRWFMLCMHIVLLLVNLFFSSSQYQYMNPINIVFHVLVISCLVFLSIYQYRELKLSKSRI